MPAEAIKTLDIANSTLDKLLTAQFLVGWAGESGEEPRLGWWQTDMCSEFGGEDLFQQILPRTHQWATLQTVREAAARTDAGMRDRAHDSDTILSLYALGFQLDEKVEDRLRFLKLSGQSPNEALPELGKMLSAEWSKDHFADWAAGHGDVKFQKAPAGRQLRGKIPDSVDSLADKLLAGLSPIAEEYPMPHFRREV